MVTKILTGKGYGHIPHLPGSRIGDRDYTCEPGQVRICTVKTRDRFDRVIVQEKLDGGCVGVHKQNGECIPITRSGNHAASGTYEHHHLFAWWVSQPDVYARFNDILSEGERLMGEWIALAHGTRYNLRHDPFVAFDLMVGAKRITVDQLGERVGDRFTLPYLLHDGGAISTTEAMKQLGEYGHHGAVDPAEGVVYRVERKDEVLFLAKFVRPGKQDGRFLPEVSGQAPIWNWRP